MTELHLDPDRLFPSDAATREIARHLYQAVAELPILSPHGHLSPELFTANDTFSDPVRLLIQEDHYVLRILHSAGFGLEQLGLTPANGTESVVPAREIWRIFCSNWHRFAGTASGYWLTSQLVGVLGIDDMPSEESADATYDQIVKALASDDLRPRSLLDMFGVEVLATTDDPMDDLAQHASLEADPSFPVRLLPNFRPDRYIDPANPTWVKRVASLVESFGAPVSDYRAYLDALAARRLHFKAHGAVAADHGVYEPLTVNLGDSDAAALYRRGLTGSLSDAESRAFQGHMLMEMARMSTEDGLVMMIHPGVFRNHSSRTFQRFGPDTGHDFPVSTEFVCSLRPLLERFGMHPGFHLVLFTVDESLYSRELAPIASFYPSVYIGAPWWFLDAPDATLRWRSAVTESAGFYRSAGFIDDSRSLLSIGTRHDMSRRLDATFLARMVREGRIDLPMAERVAVDLVHTIPREVFKL